MRLVLTALAVLLIAAPAARAETGIQFSYDDAGNPTLTAAAARDEGRPDDLAVEWRECPPDGSPCVPLPAAEYTQRFGCEGSGCRSIEARPGETVAGTRFEAAFDSEGTPSTRRTTAWKGKLVQSAPPTLPQPVVGATVSPVRGTWSGGWEAAQDVQATDHVGHVLYACREPSGTDCFTTAFGAFAPTQRWAGWYLFVDEHYNRQWSGSRLFPVAVPFPIGQLPYATAQLPVLAPNRLRSAPVQICCVQPPPPTADPPTRAVSPSAAVRARAQRRKGALHVARVTCAIRCAVRLTVKGGGGTIVRSLRVEGTRSLSIPPRRGTLRVRVDVDGKQIASGRSRTR